MIDRAVQQENKGKSSIDCNHRIMIKRAVTQGNNSI